MNISVTYLLVIQLPEHITTAIAAYLSGTATAEEREIVHNWYYSFNDEEINIQTDIVGLREQINTRMKSRLDQMIAEEKGILTPDETNIVQLNPRKSWFRRITVAASIILLIGFGIYYLVISNKSPGQTNETIARTHDILPPDKTRATITLADGSKVYLDSAGTGILATQANITVEKSEDGKIVYQPTNGIAKELVYNTLANPRGSKVIDMQLSDGSHVWLNAGSSVTYPVAFVGNERKVEITGEAYFEVAHDASHPFIVSKGETNVTVLGTHFNVNAYDDEDALRVTLLEGSVRVKSEVGSQKSEKTIKPGQQAVITDHTQLTTHDNVNIASVMAWKNGLFQFDGTDLQTVMRQIKRWYDVDVVYEKPIKQTFYGNITRQTEASKVLHMLELTEGVHFEIKGNTVIVKP